MIDPNDFTERCQITIDCRGKRNFVIEGSDAEKILKHLMEETVYSLDSGLKLSLKPSGDHHDTVLGEILPPDPDNNFCDDDTVKNLHDAWLIIHFPDVLLRLSVNCPRKAVVQKNQPHTWLCVDLGNTRTCAQLDLPDEAIDFYNVKFNLHYSGSSKSPQTGTLESICGAVWEKAANNEAPGHDPVSFVAFGKTDTDLYRRTVSTDSSNRRFLLSSPKRYFWDKQKGDLKKASKEQKSGSYFTGFSAEGAGVFEKALLQNNTEVSPRQLFQSAIVELIDQAELTLAEMKNDPKLADQLCSTTKRQQNSKEEWAEFKQTSLDPCQGITDLVMTCPAAWSQRERALYKEVIEEACELYASSRGAGCRPLNVQLSCDEATAVLIYYIREELRQNRDANQTILSWLYKYGRIQPDTQGNNRAERYAADYIPVRVRIGVLDIGGGTSDLTIAELRSEDGNNTNVRVHVSTLYSDGTNHAGDELLQVLINKILLKMIERSLVSADTWENFDEDKRHEFDVFFRNILTRHEADSNSFDREIRPLARSFWFELAIKALEVMAEAKPHEELSLSFNEEDAGTSHVEGYRDFLKVVEKKVKPEHLPCSLSLEQFNFEINENNRNLKFPDNWYDLYQEAIDITFKGTAALLCSAVIAYDCDYLLFSGKTLENNRVQEYFRNSLPCRCANFGQNDGNSAVKVDSKIATAIGAEYYARRNDEELGFSIELTGEQDNNQEDHFYWLVRPAPATQLRKISCEEPLKLTCNQSEVIISKVKFQTDSPKAAIPCYKLKYKHGRLMNNDYYDMKFNYEDGVLTLVSATRQSDRGENRNYKDDWDLSICMAVDGQQNWLDSGEILLDNNGNA